ncbi:hypothetical protein AGMMS49965_03330 [Bacteroidia bacterium]|nr:hypothetical protein AGMMS49965_03330 [Bacteroidia bacterium]
MIKKAMRKYLIGMLLAFVLPPAAAQETQEAQEMIYQSTMLGVMGQAAIYDTYITPSNYAGTNFGLFHEQMRMTKLNERSIAAQHLFNLNLAVDDVQSMAMLEYGFGLHHRFEPINGFQFFLGGQAHGMIGGVYNLRNASNNPATIKLHFDLGLSGIAAYQLEVKKQPVKLRYQATIPALGLFWAPEFGESLFEISLHKYPIVFASVHNYLSMRNVLSVEVPFKFATVRLSYVNWMYETRIHDTETRIHTNTLFFGLSKYFTVQPGRRFKQFME